jgi:hypothetical protein
MSTELYMLSRCKVWYHSKATARTVHRAKKNKKLDMRLVPDHSSPQKWEKFYRDMAAGNMKSSSRQVQRGGGFLGPRVHARNYASLQDTIEPTVVSPSEMAVKQARSEANYRRNQSGAPPRRTQKKKNNNKRKGKAKSAKAKPQRAKAKPIKTSRKRKSTSQQSGVQTSKNKVARRDIFS